MHQTDIGDSKHLINQQNMHILLIYLFFYSEMEILHFGRIRLADDAAWGGRLPLRTLTM